MPQPGAEDFYLRGPLKSLAFWKHRHSQAHVEPACDF
jgi:hypothetical protein